MNRYYLDLFSGIGGFALGAYWAGLRFNDHYFSEIDAYAIKVYKKNFPDAKELGDIRNVDYNKLPKGEWIVSGGFPCQPHSCAGKRKGFEDERDLWTECRRMLCELRPKITLFENVPGIFTTNRGQFFNRVLSDIHQSGYDAEWQVISAADVGSPHIRKRVWIVAYPRCEHGDRKSQLPENEKANRAEATTELKRSAKCNEYEIIADTVKDLLCRLPGRKKKNNTEFGKYNEYRCGKQWNENWIEVAARFCRVDDGIPARLDRLKGLGNAIVPQIAMKLWQQIGEYL